MTPPAIRVAAGALGLAAALAGALGCAWTGLLVFGAWGDPTLLGDASLALSVAAAGLAWTGVGTAVPAGLAWGLWSGAAEARIGATIFGGLLLLGPLFVLGAVVLYAAWGDEASGRFFSEVAAQRSAAATAARR